MNKKQKRGTIEKKRKKKWDKTKRMVDKIKNRQLRLKKVFTFKTPHGEVKISEGIPTGETKAIEWLKEEFESGRLKLKQ